MLELHPPDQLRQCSIPVVCQLLRELEALLVELCLARIAQFEMVQFERV